MMLHVALLLGAVAVLAQPADAQRRRSRVRTAAAAAPSRLEFGGHFGYSFGFDQWVVGGQAAVPLGQQVDFYPSLDYYTASADPAWGLNLDLRLRPPGSSASWYAGAGWNLLYSTAGSGTTDSHLNVELGATSGTGAVRTYVEGRMILINGSAFQLVGGLNFGR